MLISDNGMTATARFVPSKNCDLRPAGAHVDVIVVHCISLPPGVFGGHYIEDLFRDRLDPKGHLYFSEICELNVSSHFLVRRDGDLVQFVPTELRAWHAGASEYRGRANVNDFSVGIELEGTDDTEFTDEQYQILAQLTRALMSRYPRIRRENLVGHSDIAPGRKTDPGPLFDWQRYCNDICL